MLNAIKGLLGSKKFLLTVAGLIVAFLAKRGFNVSDEVVLAILGFFASAVLGQGIADNGKGAAQATAIADVHSLRDMPADQQAIAVDAIKSV